MAKHGAAAAGRVVPPLASLGPAEGIDTNQDHPGPIHKDIVRQVDETIIYLKSTITIHDIDTQPTPQWGLDATMALFPTSFDMMGGLSRL